MIAIHTKSGSFVPEWLNYCHQQNIPYKEVDCFASDIIEQLQGCSALLWHWEHHNYQAQLFARQLITSVEEMGIIVFPSSATCWHYDDKVGQKYLLEAIGAPLIPSYIFYNQDVALRWVEETSFPKVWKLRGGAGSQNVRLVKSKKEAKKIIRRSFRAGWSNSRLHPLKERIWHFRRDQTLISFFNILRGLVRSVIPHEKNVKAQVQRDYVYFQDFIPDNDCDIRIVIIGKRCYGFRRMTRGNDFRASGSGMMDHDPKNIPKDCIKVGFEVSHKLQLQSAAYDFVKMGDSYLIVEISYAFALVGYHKCLGYWDQSLNWRAAPVTPEKFMIEDLMAQLMPEGA